MVPPPRTGTFTPSPASALQTTASHSPHPSQAGVSAGASPSASSPTGSNALIKIVVAQVYLLLSTIKDDKDDPSKWDVHTEQLRKLIDDHGMEVFSRYFTRLVAGNASQIFPGLNRPAGNSGNYHLLVAEMHKLSHEPDQARKIAESIETGSEEIFRDFDLSSFMDHFKMDALEKTLLALAFKLGSRADLKAKADAILSTNFTAFGTILRRPDGEHADMTPSFVAMVVDRFIQQHPPNFNAPAKQELSFNVQQRYSQLDLGAPSEVLAALDLMRVLGDRPPNALALYIHRTGIAATRNEETCVAYLQSRPNNVQLSEEQVSVALTYTSISQNPPHNPSVLVAALRLSLPPSFRWQDVVSYFDHRGAHISPPQFLRLYQALVPIAEATPDALDIQRLWGGNWDNFETQLSFICAFTSLRPDQLDATTIPGLQPTFKLESYADAPPAARERAAEAVKHPLVSLAAISAIFHVALHSMHASTNVEAKRLFQEVVVPNLDIFVVSAFGVPKPWSPMAVDTLNPLFSNFLSRNAAHRDFVLDSLWRKDKAWVIQRLVETHAAQPAELPLIFEHAVKYDWINELIYLPSGFGNDLAAYAHGQGCLDLGEWATNCADRNAEMARSLMQFLLIKAGLELQSNRAEADATQPQPPKNIPLQIRTVSALLAILQDFLPTGSPMPDLIMVQRQCIITYPRLINYGEGYDDIIEANGKDGHALPAIATTRMEEHFKKMYGNEIEVRTVVEALEHLKHSRDALDQDVFDCMIASLFDEYSHFGDYPLEALATTAVLFGGIIRHKLISGLPLTIGLGMILEAVRDHASDHPMYKFGLQALMQLFPRLREWPPFCVSLLQIAGLRGTEAWKRAEEVVRDNEEESEVLRGSVKAGTGAIGAAEPMMNGNGDALAGPDQHPPPFMAVNADAIPLGAAFEDPSADSQGKIQFCLNNLDHGNMETRFLELRPLLDGRHRRWFASHIVEERAKRMPNYHNVYLDLVTQFQDKSLWAQVLRETYVSVSHMLNAEATLQNSSERTNLKNLGAWLGLMTLARDRPIRHKNVAFKQLLIEAHDTKRLIVVIPFVCKVLLQGKPSNIFKPPNPWLMDIIHFLIELYHHAELKLNLKFEIEVLCKGLDLDHKSIEPSGEILNRVPAEEPAELPPEGLDAFENLSLNGIGAGVAGNLSPHAVAPSIPDLGPSLTVPQVSEMVVSSTRLHEIVRNALTRALQDIIQPVVDRSVAIAAIATQQMIHKDFATELDEDRIRTSAINMVKATAGSLAQVTSKEPLRANFTNYMRSLSNDLPQGTLPEGTIIMCVNSNLDLASSIIEKSTEERAVPEIEEMLRPELESRRLHRMQRPNEPYVDQNLSRWAMTIPPPFKLHPSMNGLNPEQMAIYEDFARPPRVVAAPAAPSHVPSSSDATRSLANEVLQDQYSSVPSVPTPAETPSVPNLGPQMQQYPHAHSAGMVNGRQLGGNIDSRNIADRIPKLVNELQRAATEASEEHFVDLPRPHPVLDVVDALVQAIIKVHQTSEDYHMFAAEQVCRILFSPQANDTLALETAAHVLDTLRKIAGPLFHVRLSRYFQEQAPQTFLNVHLISVLLGMDLLDWRTIDRAVAEALNTKKPGSIAFLSEVMELTLLNDNPVALYSDFVHSLEEAWNWIAEDPDVDGGQEFKTKILAPIAELPPTADGETAAAARRHQMEYIFEEWIHLFSAPDASDKMATIFVEQMHAQGMVSSRDDFFEFFRVALDKSVDTFDHRMAATGGVVEAFVSVDALSYLAATFIKLTDEEPGERKSSRAALLDSILALGVVVLNHHYVKRGERFNQRVFHRFFSMMLHGMSEISDELTAADRTESLLNFAARFGDLGPAVFPGFVYGWLALIEHRVFLPAMLQLGTGTGWAPFTKILKQLFEFIGEQFKSIEVTAFAKDMYRATLKLLAVVHHDFPEYLVANHVQLCESLPAYCTQFINMILISSPVSADKIPDPTTLAGLRVDRMEDARKAPESAENPARLLSRIGLLGLLDRALQAGPTEDVIAPITYAITQGDWRRTTYGNVPVVTNSPVIDAVVSYIGEQAAARAGSGGPVLAPGAADLGTLSMLLHELPAEGRYYFLNSVVNQLRYPNAHTTFFSQALLEIFAHDMADPEEMELREQITRVLFERVIGFWPQPWGLLVTLMELVKNDRIMFFDLPFLKAAPEISERFAHILSRS